MPAPPPAPASAAGELTPATHAGIEAAGAAATSNGAGHIRLRMPAGRQGSPTGGVGAGSSGASCSGGSKHGGGSVCGGQPGSDGGSTAAEDEAGGEGYFVDWQMARLWRRPEGLMILWLLTALLVGIIAGAATGGTVACYPRAAMCTG